MNKRPYDWILHIADLCFTFNERSYGQMIKDPLLFRGMAS